MPKTIDYSQWQEMGGAPPHEMSIQHWQWLRYAGSLTEQLQHHFGDQIKFCFIAEGWDEIRDDEREILDVLDKDEHWVRRIEWRYHDTLWIAARTIIPKKWLHPPLQQMGNASIGHYLFRTGGYQRGAIQIAKLLPDEALRHSLDLPLTSIETCGWKRRSLFSMGADKLLVSEMFFPTFFQHNF